jgi:hypothetical protein
MSKTELWSVRLVGDGLDQIAYPPWSSGATVLAEVLQLPVEVCDALIDNWTAIAGVTVPRAIRQIVLEFD